MSPLRAMRSDGRTTTGVAVVEFDVESPSSRATNALPTATGRRPSPAHQAGDDGAWRRSAAGRAAGRRWRRSGGAGGAVGGVRAAGRGVP